VPLRTARVAGRQLLVWLRSIPVFFFIVQQRLRAKLAFANCPWRLRQLSPGLMSEIAPRQFSTQADPVGWHAFVALAFALLTLVRLSVPGAPYFDEVHYLPAARALLEGHQALNLEHPPLAKQIMALGITLFGDRPLGWRLMSAGFGTLALFATMRATWRMSGLRAASVLAGILVATNFLLFVHARIAMLDIFMVGFVMLALWMCAGWICGEAGRFDSKPRWRLAIAGIAMGAAMACKWNAIVLAVLPGLAFLALRIWAARGRFLFAREGAPIDGVPLWEAGLWLGLLPLAVYAASFAPYIWLANPPAEAGNLIALHRHMLDLQTQVPEPHPYQSVWWQWVLNQRAIWYLYESIDGAQRGVMLIGNPATMLAGLPALAWCAWAGLRHKRWDCLTTALLYCASLSLWVAAPKPVQFYFHYLLPGIFLSMALALAIAALWHSGRRVIASVLALAPVALFAFWFAILTAAQLDSDQAFLNWAWFVSWQ